MFTWCAQTAVDGSLLFERYTPHSHLIFLNWYISLHVTILQQPSVSHSLLCQLSANSNHTEFRVCSASFERVSDTDFQNLVGFGYENFKRRPRYRLFDKQLKFGDPNEKQTVTKSMRIPTTWAKVNITCPKSCKSQHLTLSHLHDICHNVLSDMFDVFGTKTHEFLTFYCGINSLGTITQMEFHQVLSRLPRYLFNWRFHPDNFYAVSVPQALTGIFGINVVYSNTNALRYSRELAAGINSQDRSLRECYYHLRYPWSSRPPCVHACVCVCINQLVKLGLFHCTANNSRKPVCIKQGSSFIKVSRIFDVINGNIGKTIEFRLPT